MRKILLSDLIVLTLTLSASITHSTWAANKPTNKKSAPPATIEEKTVKQTTAIPTPRENFITLKKEAKALLENKDYQKAFALYQELVRFAPADKEINYGLAWSASAIGRFTHAILAYERLIADEPENSKLHLQLAHVYAYLGNQENAHDEIQKAKLHDPNISPEVEEKVLFGFDGKVRPGQQTPGRFIRGQLGFGLMYDTNANQGPNSNTLRLGAFDNLLFAGAKKVPSWANYANARVEGGIRSSDAPKWWFVWDAGVYQRWNFNSSLEDNNGFLLGRVGLGAMYLGERSMLDLRLKGEPGQLMHKESPNQSLTAYGPEMTFMLNIAPQWITTTHASFENRHYTDPDSNSGEYWSLGQYLQRSFDAGRFMIEAGGRVYGSSLDDFDLSYHAREFSLRTKAKVSRELEISPFAAYSKTNYHGPATALETDNRDDSRYRLGVSASWYLDADLSLECTYQYVKNKSNSELYEYKQSVINAGVVWRF